MTAIGWASASRSAAERRAEVCEAVFALLAEVGYDRMTMDAVAARAHVSKATIYRTWPDKPELVAEALAYRFRDTPTPPDTGSLRDDLIAVAGRACEASTSLAGGVVAGVMTAATRNPALARTLREVIYERKHTIHETVVRRAVDRGEVRPDTDPHLLHEVLHAMMLSRRLEMGGPLDEGFARHVVDDVLIPLLTRDRT